MVDVTILARTGAKQATPERHHRPSQISKEQIRVYFSDSLLSQRAYAIAIYDTILEVSVNQFRAGQSAVMSYAELAELVGCSLNTIKRVVRGLTQLGLLADLAGKNPRSRRTFVIKAGPAKNLSSTDITSAQAARESLPRGNHEEINCPQDGAKILQLSPEERNGGVNYPQGMVESLPESCPAGLATLPINESRIDSLKNDSLKNESGSRLSQRDRDLLKNTLKGLLKKLDPTGGGANGADIKRLYNLFGEVSQTTAVADFVLTMRQAADLTQYSVQQVRRPIPYFFGVLKVCLANSQSDASAPATKERPSLIRPPVELQEPVSKGQEPTPLLPTSSKPHIPELHNPELGLVTPSAQPEEPIHPVQREAATAPPTLWLLITTKLGLKIPGFSEAKQRLRFLANNDSIWTIGVTKQDDLRWKTDLEKELSRRNDAISLVFVLVKNKE